MLCGWIESLPQKGQYFGFFTVEIPINWNFNLQRLQQNVPALTLNLEPRSRRSSVYLLQIWYIIRDQIMKCPPKIEPLERLGYVNNAEIIFNMIIGQTSIDKNSNCELYDSFMVSSWCHF